MGRDLILLMRQKEFLVQLFAGAQTGEDDLDITLHLQSGQANQVVGQIHDADGLAHIKHKDFAALAHHRRLQHQLHRFGDGHEIARDLRVRERHRTTLGNLAFERQHHTPPAA